MRAHLFSHGDGLPGQSRNPLSPPQVQRLFVLCARQHLLKIVFVFDKAPEAFRRGHTMATSQNRSAFVSIDR
jgi:hypothetical protein